MRIIGRPRHLLVLLAAACLLAGCGAGPSQLGSAVIIGDHSVSVDEVQQKVNRVVEAEPAAKQLAQNRKLDMVSRELVRQLVVHELLARAVQREGLVLDEAKVAEIIKANPFAEKLPADGSVPPEAMAQQLAYRARDTREVIVDQVLLQQLGTKYLNHLAVTFDYTTVLPDDPAGQSGALRDRAFEKVNQLAAGPDAAAKVIRDDAQHGIEASVGERLPAAQSPKFAETVLFGVPAGTVIAFQPSPQQAGWIVAVIRERTTDSHQPVDQAAQATPQDLVAVGQRLLQPLVKDAGVKLNPRYGVWDEVTMGLAPTAAETAGIVQPIRSTPRS